MKILSLVFCFGALLWQDTNQNKIRHRIVNGKEVSIERNPCQVGLKISYHDKTALQCGGSLISRKHILTAAHCFRRLPEDPEEVRVLMGSERSIRAFDEGELYKPFEQSQRCSRKCWINHPDYDPVTSENDIAIITLRFEVKLSSKVQPIRLPKITDSIQDMVNKTAVVTGWGRTENGEVSDTLRAVSITLTDQNCPEKCICYTPVNNRSACKGDSGGPIVMDKMIVGIVSRVYQIYETRGTTFYKECVVNADTSVIDYLDWIHTVTKIPIRN